MSLALERVLAPASGFPAPQRSGRRSRAQRRRCLYVGPVNIGGAEESWRLANRLSGRITLVVPQVVPYPSAHQSARPADWNEKRFRVIAGESPVETTVQIYLCRDRLETLTAVLSPARSSSSVSQRWWPTAEQRLVRTLRPRGQEVISRKRSKPCSICFTSERLCVLACLLGFYESLRQA